MERDELVTFGGHSVPLEGTYFIKDRGTVLSISNPVLFDRDQCPYINGELEWEGRHYLIIGVESYAISPIPVGSKIGLLISEIWKEAK